MLVLFNLRFLGTSAYKFDSLEARAYSGGGGGAEEVVIAVRLRSAMAGAGAGPLGLTGLTGLLDVNRVCCHR